MFFIFFDVVDDCSSHLDLREKIEISQDKEHFGRLFKLVASIFLKYEQVIVLYKLLSGTSLRLRVLYAVVGLPKSVSVREDVEANLKDENGEINVRNFVVEPLQLGIDCWSYLSAIIFKVSRGLNSTNLLVFNH